MNRWIAVAKASQFAPGSQTCAVVDGAGIAVFNVDGALHAIENACPHAHAPLSEGYVEGTHVVCPWHAAVFDLATGELIEGPCHRGVKRYNVKTEGDEILVEIPQE
ncbi:MAG: Rieske (2Fe-2S) protein [Candidatus Omnitrophota bacterium]